MNGKLRIFVAGAKNLKTERDSIKALANDLNSRYISKGISVIAHSYDHFDDDQIVYNSFIEDEADIVIFVIDKYLGSGTEEEFVKATDSLKNNGHPEVMVFVKDYGNDITPEIARVQGLIKGVLGSKYYVDYSSLDDLKSKARERIVRFIDQNDKSLSKEKNKEVHNKIQDDTHLVKNNVRIISYRLVALIAAIIIFGMYIWHTCFPSTLLVIAGGGSARNYVERNCDIAFNQYPHSWTCALPSESSWRILTEEVQQKTRSRKINRYVTVCLSASQMDDSFKQSHKDVDDNGISGIVEILIGYDTLAVYVQNDLLEEAQLELCDNNTISCEQLYDLMNNINKGIYEAKIFTTTEPSGTLNSYKKAMAKIDTTIMHQYIVYYDGTRAKVFDDAKKYLILGSVYFFVDALQNPEQSSKYTRLLLKNNGKYVEKPIYLYFCVYKNNDNYLIDDAVLRFLKDINLEISGYYLKQGKREKLILGNEAKTNWHNLLQGNFNDSDSRFIGTIHHNK